MKYIIYVFVGLFAAIVALAVYVRVAPIDVPLLQSWMYPFAPGEKSWANGYHVAREVDAPEEALVALNRIIMDTPRTERVAGSIESGVISYVTRSAIWRFPDFTTVYAGPDDTVEGGFSTLFRIDGRAIYGASDLGVNKNRIKGWLAQLDGDQS